MRGDRKKLGVLVFVSALMLAQVILPGAHAVSGTGTLSTGHPGTITPRGVTEAEFRNVKVCSSIPASQGVDGWVIDLNGVSGTFSVTGSSTGLFSLNLTFFNSACFPSGIWFTVGTSTSKAIPVGTRWALISAAYGAQINLAYSY